MSLLIPDLERQLCDVVDRRQTHHWRSPSRRRGLVLTVAAVVPAIVVGALALLLLRPNHDRVGVAARGAPHAIPGQTTAIERCAEMTGSRLEGFGRPSSTGSTASIASGTIEGYPWDLRARADQNGFLAVEDGRLVLDGHAYSMCAGAPNPAEFALIDKGSRGIVYGYIANPGQQAITLTGGGQKIAVSKTVDALGGTFFIIALPRSACSYPSLTLNATSQPPHRAKYQHYFGFGLCHPNQAVRTTAGHGSWSGTALTGGRPSSLGQGPTGPSLAELLDHFAVLRRAQTVADRSWRGGVARGAPPDVTLTSLTRLARTLGNGDRVFLTVEQFTQAAGDSTAKAGSSVLMSVNLVDRQGNVDGALYSGQVSDYTIIPTTLGERPGLERFAAQVHGHISPRVRQLLRRQAQFGPPVWTSMVPDGVAKVRWTFTCEPSKLTSCRDFPKPLIVDVPVDENLATAQIPATDKCADAGCRPATVTWYDAAGQQTASFNAQTALGSGPQPKPFAGAP